MPEVFQFRVTDKITGDHTVETRLSTRERIVKVGGLIFDDTRRVVSDQFIDSDGRAVIDPAGIEGGILRAISDAAPKPCRVEGSTETLALHKLRQLKFVEAWPKGMDLADCVLTELGKTAVEQLIAAGGTDRK